MNEIFFIVIAYIIGSISSAVVVCRLFSISDPREQGSGNPGATNVLRLGGRWPAFLTLVADAFKGFAAIYLAQLANVGPAIMAWVLVAVFIGHLYPIFFGFKGGKGVATTIGALMALSTQLGLILLGSWLLLIVLFRISSLAAIITTLISPFFVIGVLGEDYVTPYLIVTALLLWRHKGNISRLLTGTEPGLGRS